MAEQKTKTKTNKKKHMKYPKLSETTKPIL